MAGERWRADDPTVTLRGSPFEVQGPTVQGSTVPCIPSAPPLTACPTPPTLPRTNGFSTESHEPPSPLGLGGGFAPAIETTTHQRHHPSRLRRHVAGGAWGHRLPLPVPLAPSAGTSSRPSGSHHPHRSSFRGGPAARNLHLPPRRRLRTRSTNSSANGQPRPAGGRAALNRPGPSALPDCEM
jgi:hypothetical protein